MQSFNRIRKFLRVSLCSVVWLASVAIAQKPQPLLKPVEIVSSFDSVEQMIPHLYVSHATPDANPYVIAGKDTTEAEQQAILDFSMQTGTGAWAAKYPKKNLEIWYIRYHGGKRSAAALANAKAAGIGRIVVLIHLNDSLKIEFAPLEKITTDFSRATPKDDALGQFITALLASGFQYNNSPYGIYGILTRAKERTDLMHLKELLFVARDDHGQAIETRAFDGTANGVSHGPDEKTIQVTRLNTMLEFAGGNIPKHMLAHAEALAEAFRSGKPIKDMTPQAPLRETFKNGEYLELAFTCGRFNPNERIVEALTTKKVKKIWFSQFLITHTGIIDATAKVLNQDDFEGVFGIFDSLFARMNGYGLSGLLDGFIQFLPYGRNRIGVNDKLERKTDLWMYLRKIEGVKEIDLENAHLTRHIWHDKTTILEVEEDGETWYYLFTLSLNGSNHFQNAESQLMGRLRKDSPLARAYIQTIEGIVKMERQYAVPYPTGVIRIVIGELLAHSDIEISEKDAEEVDRLIRRKWHNKLRDKLMELASTPTDVRPRPDPKKIQERIDHFVDFYRWHAKEFPNAYREGVEVLFRRLLVSAVALTRPTPAHQIYDALRIVTFDPKDPQNETKRLERIRAAWRSLGLPDSDLQEVLKPKTEAKTKNCSEDLALSA